MISLSIWNIVLGVLVGYLIGSFPTGVISSRLLGGQDPRMVGSGHTGGTNVFRNINRVAGVITAVVDTAKGALAVWLMLQLVPDPWIVPITGTAAVAGHCWPVFTQFRGGMGVGTAGGLALWFFPLLIPIIAAIYFALHYAFKHQARAMMLTSALIPMILLVLKVDLPYLILGAGISVVLIIRWASDFYRVYE
jgi:glycerol-3-phosphate acyltransferase PlsY